VSGWLSVAVIVLLPLIVAAFTVLIVKQIGRSTRS
jgi:hypothetical protein